ncbi:MAG: hypothetical protein ACMVP2_17075 [Imperialibacter sp.]|uniref:hypothetical protein n=1 Tax=Imperialibacter sp. TaxID=2038411 RepID=UPI003A895810
MKFPIVFRIYAVLNLLIFFGLALQSVLVFLQPGFATFWWALASCFTCVWFLISSLMWMTGSRKSYAVLYLTALAGLLTSASILYQGLAVFEYVGKSDFLVMFAYALLFFVYSLLLFATTFFKSVKAWAGELNSPKPAFEGVTTGMFAGVAIVISLGYIYVDKTYLRDTYVDNSNNYYGPVGGCTTVHLNALTEFDHIKISAEYNTPGRVIVSFADRYDAVDLSEYFRSDTIMLEEKDGYLYASFPAVWARKMVFCQDQVYLTTADIELRHSIAFFDIDRSSERFFLRDGLPVPQLTGAEEEEYYEEEYYDGDDMAEAPAIEFYEETGPKTLDEAHRTRFLTSMLDWFVAVILPGEESFYFNTSSEELTINGTNMGVYAHFATLFRSSLPDGIRQYLKAEDGNADSYSLQRAVSEASGFNLYQTTGDMNDLPFSRLNPNFVSWMGNNLVPEPNQQFFGEEAGKIYRVSFRRMVWMLATSYEYLSDGNKWESEALAYKNAMQSEGFYGPGYLYDRYATQDLKNSVFSKYYEEFSTNDNDYYYFTEEIAIGFWLRRRLDGTDDEMSQFLTKLLEKLDSYTWG